MSIVKAYGYFFYKLYKFWDAASIPKLWSDWKAALTMDVLEVAFVFSVIFHYSNFTKKPIDFGSGGLSILVYVIVIALPNYFIFNHRDQWKEMVREFDQWPKRKNEIGTIVVWGVVSAVIANLILAFYLMSQIDWQSLKPS